MVDYPRNALPPTARRLVMALKAFLAAEPSEKQRLLQGGAEILLHPVAEAQLRGVAKAMRGVGADIKAEFYTSQADLLAACREWGVATVFAFIQDGPAVAMPDDLRNALADLGDLHANSSDRDDPACLNQEIALSRRILTMLSRTDHPDLWVSVHRTLEYALESLLRPALDELTGFQASGSAGDDSTRLHHELNLCRRILTMVPRTDHPDLWTRIQGTLGNALRCLGDLTSNATDLRAAEAAYRNVLLELTRERAPMDWAATQANLGEVLQSLSDLTGDPVALSDAEAAYREALLELTREQAPMDWATTQGSLGNVLARLGKLTGDAEMLRAARAAYHDALLELTRERAPMNWATTQNNLGNVLLTLGDLTGEAAMLREAESAFRAALEVRTRERAPMDWVMTQNNLGSVLHSLGALNGDKTVLRAAEAVYRDALREFSSEKTSLVWGIIQNNLGKVLQSLATLTGEIAELHAAEVACREALEACTREGAPMDWAAAQAGLGTVLVRLGVQTGDAAMLRAAEAANRAALLELTRERAPLDWAKTRSNLGYVLARLGALIGDTMVLREAEWAYRGVLDFTRERAPMDWAATQTSLGSVLTQLGDLAGDAAVLRAAEAAFRAALLEETLDRAPIEWAATQSCLGNVLERLGALTGDLTVLRAAETAQRTALLTCTRELAPRNWAAICACLGNILSRLGDLSGDTTELRDAEEAFRDALLEFTRDRSPIDWAATQTSLGFVLYRLGDLTDDAALLRLSEAAYRAALEVLDASGEEDSRQRCAVALARMLARQERFEDATASIVPTIARSDGAIADASRSRHGRARAIEVVSDLHGLLSLCHLRHPDPDIGAAFSAAASGRARLLADALAFEGVGVESISDPEVRGEIERATARRRELRFRLGYDRADSTSPPRELASDHRARLQGELHEASEAWVTLLRRHGVIRTLPPLDPSDIRAAVPDGGVLVLPVLTEHAAFTFVITENGQPAVIELPGLDRRAVVAHLSGETEWLGVYHRHFREHEGKDPAAAAAWEQRLTGTLAWLWERLLAPIHVHLRDVARLAPNAPVVLLPPGLLGLLPLHAAGPGPDGRYFGDHWTVSYAPSVRSLLTCQERRDARASKPVRLLAAIDPDGSLSGARAEGPMLRQRFTARDQEPVVLTGEEATIARVLGALADATVFHASTHGTHDWMEPARSGLSLADGVLQLDMLRHARLDAMRLVFLSACESGLAGVRKLPEEFIGLPTGLVEAGAAAVVGSLWPIGDTSAFLLARRFYDLMFDAAGQERMAPATALREACAWLRGVTYGELKQEFPIAHLPSGPVLVLRSARMMPGALEPDRPAPPEEPHLPLLGSDEERPFAHPTHWAAFACTGC